MKHGIGQIARQRERKDPREGATFANAVQKWLLENTRLGIPAILHDEIHGHMAEAARVFRSRSRSLRLGSGVHHQFFTAGALETRARGSHQVLGQFGFSTRCAPGRTGRDVRRRSVSHFAHGVAIVKALQGLGRTSTRTTSSPPRNISLRTASPRVAPIWHSG